MGRLRGYWCLALLLREQWTALPACRVDELMNPFDQYGVGQLVWVVNGPLVQHNQALSQPASSGDPVGFGDAFRGGV